jgi:hypothetical protein
LPNASELMFVVPKLDVGTADHSTGTNGYS